MRLIRGTLRIFIFLIMLLLTTLLVLGTAWLPVRVKGVRLSAWLLVPFAACYYRCSTYSSPSQKRTASPSTTALSFPTISPS